MESNCVASTPGAVCAADGKPRRVDRAIDAFQSAQDPEAAFRAIFDLYFPAVRRFFGRKGFSAADSLDLTQETFLGIYRGLGTYRREARFETWLFKIATTTYLKRLRARHTAKRDGDEVAHEDLPSEMTLATPGDQLENVLADERRARLARAVDELPDQMRKCLTLRIYQDLKYREIANLMRISVDTVKVHLFQARKRLKDRLSTLEVAP